LRPLNFAQKAAIPLYGTQPTLKFVRKHFDYAFSEGSQGSTRPSLELVEIHDSIAFQVGSVPVMPFDIYHGTWTITGFRIGSLGYVTDASAIPPASLAQLYGLDLLVLNALRHQPHPTHFSLDQALEQIEVLRPRRALLVHMTHDMEHQAVNTALPDHVRLAFDGQIVEIGGENYAAM
jgi:phosphoribosyl 1,2-cyclic phosphate phosphodiesterase